MTNKKNDAIAKVDDVAVAPATDEQAAMLALFAPATEITIDRGAAEIIYTPSVTVPPGGAIKGAYSGRRTETVIRDAKDGGGTDTFDSFLISNANGTGKDVWIRGGWNLAQLITLSKVEPNGKHTLTVIRDNRDKQHPKNPKARIAQFKVFVS